MQAYLPSATLESCNTERRLGDATVDARLERRRRTPGSTQLNCVLLRYILDTAIPYDCTARTVCHPSDNPRRPDAERPHRLTRRSGRESGSRQEARTPTMPTITLRISEEEHRDLQAMAAWKKASMSDLVRAYTRAGIIEDARNSNIREEIDKTIQREQDRLEAIAKVLEAAAAHDPGQLPASEQPPKPDAQRSAKPDVEHPADPAPEPEPEPEHVLAGVGGRSLAREG
jgi:hypothetical protein